MDCLTNEVGGELHVMVDHCNYGTNCSLIGEFSSEHHMRLQLLLDNTRVHGELVQPLPRSLLGLKGQKGALSRHVHIRMHICVELHLLVDSWVPAFEDSLIDGLSRL